MTEIYPESLVACETDSSSPDPPVVPAPTLALALAPLSSVDEEVEFSLVDLSCASPNPLVERVCEDDLLRVRIAAALLGIAVMLDDDDMVCSDRCNEEELGMVGKKVYLSAVRGATSEVV